MFVLVSYDVATGRTERFRKLLSRYLVHEQNSVFCGLIAKPDFRELETNLKVILTEADCILMIVCENRLNMNLIRMGDDDGLRMERKSVVL